MPVIASFDGITIRMFFNDHPPPHFHIQHGGDRAIMTIADARLIAGTLPLPAQRQVAEWCELQRTRLFEVWRDARLGRPLGEV